MQIFIMMNNYFHDFAAALLVTSAVVIFVLARSVERQGHIEAVRYFVGIFPNLTLLARVSMGWIIIAGAIRLYFYTGFEWAEAVGKDQVPALIVKHMMLFAAVGVGVYFWVRLSRKVRRLRERVEEYDRQGEPGGPAKAEAAGRSLGSA